MSYGPPLLPSRLRTHVRGSHVWINLPRDAMGAPRVGGRIFLRHRVSPHSRLRASGPRSIGCKKEAVVYRTPISAQWSRGWWGRGNAKGMRLVVREKSFELSYPFPGGSFLTTEWYCWSKDARMKMGLGNFLPPRVKRDCIILSIPSIDEPNAEQEILISSVPPLRQDLSAAWDALVVCGVRVSGDPHSKGS
jgi:hypothetical protein